MIVPFAQTERRPIMSRRLAVTAIIALTAGMVSLLYNRSISSAITDDITSLDLLATSHASRLPRAADGGRHRPYEIAHRHENTSIADRLYKKVKVLCWVMTHPENHRARADHIKATWGKRCNILLFMSTEADETLPTIKLPVKEGYDHLWAKTKAAFRYVYQHYRKQADWFLKADDDTYVIMENLRLLLSNHSSQEPVYFGHLWKAYIPGGYMSGGAGYVLSRKALYRFIEDALPNNTICNDADAGPEDVHMGCCLVNVNVSRGESRDVYQRVRFFPGDVESQLFPVRAPTYATRSYHPLKQGLAYASDYPISFHDLSPGQLYVVDFLLYHLRPYGIRIKPYGGGIDYLSDVPISFHYATPQQLYELEFLTYHLRPYGIRRGAMKKTSSSHSNPA